MTLLDCQIATLIVTVFIKPNRLFLQNCIVIEVIFDMLLCLLIQLLCIFSYIYSIVMIAVLVLGAGIS